MGDSFESTSTPASARCGRKLNTAIALKPSVGNQDSKSRNVARHLLNHSTSSRCRSLPGSPREMISSTNTAIPDVQLSPHQHVGTYSACGEVDVDVVLVRVIRLSQMSLAPVARKYDSPVLRQWAFMNTVGADTCCIAVLLTYRQQQCCFSCTCHFPCSNKREIIKRLSQSMSFWFSFQVSVEICRLSSWPIEPESPHAWDRLCRRNVGLLRLFLTINPSR